MKFLSNKMKMQGIITPCIFLERVDSTNLLAKRLINSGKIKEKAVIIANSQDGGRGRYDRKFLSARGKGIYLSYVFATDLDKDVSFYSVTAALAVVDMLENLYSIKSSVKWPNDIIVNGNKICGILPESTEFEGQRYVILGIGVNINYEVKDFGELADIATSVRLALGKRVKLEESCVQLTLDVEREIDKFNLDPSNYHERYKELCNTLGRTVKFVKNGETFTGRAVDVDENCSLILDVDGERTPIYWGEVTVINEQQQEGN